MSATARPWPRRKLGEIAQIQGGIQKQSKRAPRETHYPFLRVANVTAKGLDLSEIHRIELFGDELDRLRLRRGDLLVVEGNGSPSQIGRAAIWNGAIADCVHQNHLIRVRAGSVMLPEYLHLYWNSPANRDFLSAISSSTSGLHTLSVRKLQQVEVPVPTLEEQRRIVAILDDHLSRLDAATAYLDAARRRAHSQVKAILLSAVPELGEYPAGWRIATTGEAGQIQLGRQRHPDWHRGTNMRPYLRVANVFEDRIDTTDLMEMHWPEVAFQQYRLVPGDVLLNEGQSPELLGRPALYRGDPAEVAFTNTLLRFRARPDVLPEWALLVFRRHMHAGRFRRESRITTNIGHLSASRLKTIEFPIPPLTEQRHLVERTREGLDDLERVTSAISALTRRQNALRRSLLAAAFSGGLTSQPVHESTEEVA